MKARSINYFVHDEVKEKFSNVNSEQKTDNTLKSLQNHFNQDTERAVIEMALKQKDLV